MATQQSSHYTQSRWSGASPTKLAALSLCLYVTAYLAVAGAGHLLAAADTHRMVTDAPVAMPAIVALLTPSGDLDEATAREPQDADAEPEQSGSRRRFGASAASDSCACD